MLIPASRAALLRHVRTGLFAGLALLVLPAQAETTNQRVTDIYTLGATKVMPSLDMQYKYDDNIFESEQNKTSSLITVLKPGLAMSVDNGISEAALMYSAENASYQDSPEDDYTDQRMGLGFHHAFRRWAILDLGVGYDQLHEARGEAYSQGNATALLEPDKYKVISSNAMFRLGTRKSRGMFEYKVAGTSLRYTTREDLTAGRNYNYLNGRLTYHFNISSKTSLLAETRYGLYDYVSESSVVSRDSNEQHHYLGLSWEYSKLSSGAIKVGQQTKNFNDTSLTGDSGLSWEVSMLWKPTQLTTIKMVSSGKNQESVGVGTHVLSRSGFISIRNSLTRLIAIDLRANATHNTYRPNDRAEALGAFSMKLIFSPQSWVHLEMGGEHSQRRSDQVGLDYRRNIISIGLRISV